MRGDNKRIQQLAEKWRQHTITNDERQEFEAWYAAFDDTNLQEQTHETLSDFKDRLYQSILQKENIQVFESKPIYMWKRLAVAASMAAVLGVGGWFFIQHQQRAGQQQAMAAIKPGGSKAVLTLANGQKVILNDAQTGKVATQGNVLVSKTADGKLVYQGNRSAGAEEVQYNVMTTPRGGQYAVTLADGTRVLLNAASTLKYPVKFTGNNREVELTGEAYFEVVHNAASPFKVKAAGQTIEDIGTQFNINAYADEADSRTTLLEGSVKVTTNGTPSHTLKPGEQAVLQNGELSIANVNTEEVTAWKNGYFMFESEDITSIMRKISRWYNVDVVYDGPVPADKFGGTVNRFGTVAQVLTKLELTNKVHFKVEGRRIMVSR